MSTTALSTSDRIARLNDLARQAMGMACTAVTTPGFRSLPSSDQSAILDLIETYDTFTPDNDPYGERDFGEVYLTRDGKWTAAQPTDRKPLETVFWKIDAYDRNLRFGSEDPADPAITRRVLTIMLASEY